jgi:Cu(I)/Ag(I) efflux system membrane fusion protein
MFPNQKFDKPGKSPFMDMQLVPRYADGGSAGAAPTVAVDRRRAAEPGIAGRRGEDGAALPRPSRSPARSTSTSATSPSSRRAGRVREPRLCASAWTVRAGAPIADLLLPEWGGRTEYLSVRRLGKPDLTAAARQRLRLMGMSDGLIASVERADARTAW